MRNGSAEDRVKAAKGIHVVANEIGKDRTNSELLPFLAGVFPPLSNTVCTLQKYTHVYDT